MYKSLPLICLMALSAVLAISSISAQESSRLTDAANNTSLANATSDALPGQDMNSSSVGPSETINKQSPGSGFALGGISSKPGYEVEGSSRSMPMYDISKYSNIRPMYNIEKFSNILPTYNMSTRIKPGVRVDDWPFVCDIV